MASYTRHFSFLFFLALLSTLHAYARESHFFSKFNNEGPQPLSKGEQEPKFIPDTHNGYGLYGHKSGHLPTTRTTTSAPYTTTNLPYETESREPYQNINSYHYKKNVYVTDPQGISDNGLSDTRFTHRGYTTGAAATNANTKKYVTQKQGMSDTRFLENGKYYYDLESENNYHKGYHNSRGVDYNNRGYYGKNENSYEYNNSMEGYENQEEFKESQEDYVP